MLGQLVGADAIFDMFLKSQARELEARGYKEKLVSQGVPGDEIELMLQMAACLIGLHKTLESFYERDDPIGIVFETEKIKEGILGVLVKGTGTTYYITRKLFEDTKEDENDGIPRSVNCLAKAIHEARHWLQKFGDIRILQPSDILLGGGVGIHVFMTWLNYRLLGTRRKLAAENGRRFAGKEAANEFDADAIYSLAEVKLMDPGLKFIDLINLILYEPPNWVERTRPILGLIFR